MNLLIALFILFIIVIFRVQLEKLRSAIKDGRNNEATKHNKILLNSEEKLNRFNSDLKKAMTQVGCSQLDCACVCVCVCVCLCVLWVYVLVYVFYEND